MTCGAPLLSCRLASWIATANGRPSVSTIMCSFRPLIFFDFLVPVYTAVRINMMGSLHTSGIHDAKAGAFLTPCLFTDESVQGIHHLFKHAFKLPFTEIVIDGLPRGEVRGKHTPLAAGLVDIKDCIHYLFKRMFSVPRLRF